MAKALCAVSLCLFAVVRLCAAEPTLAMPKVGDCSLRILAPRLLELTFINTQAPEQASPPTWNFVDEQGSFRAPAISQFVVTADGVQVPVQSVPGFKRRPVYAPAGQRDLRVQNRLYLRLGQAIGDHQLVAVKNPGQQLWTSAAKFIARADPLRHSPVIHVNQEGYVPDFPKKAMAGYYLGSAGELAIPLAQGFKLVDPDGHEVFSGPLAHRPDVGYTYVPTPYQRVYEADLSAFNQPGTYRLVVPGLGASLPFRIDPGVPMAFARAYALGLYHQRCGTANELPFTRFTHGPCHTEQAFVPVPRSSFEFTWDTIADYSADFDSDPRHSAPQLRDPSSQRYPFVRTGRLDVSGGHHDAGDYGKYTINSAGLIHYLVFAVDAFESVGVLDNLGVPESGDGISDLLTEAKWEADFLVKMQDSDGGFYFLVHPRDRQYENDVLPDEGDPQVVWPRNTAATAAATAALAQLSSSPQLRQHFPASAALYFQKAQAGWKFLTNAIARFGKDGAYQKLTHYGNEFLHDDELAWAACEMFLATGDPAYHRKLLEWFPNPSVATARRYAWWRMYEGYGRAIRSYAFASRTGRITEASLNSAYFDACKREVIAAAADHVTRASNNAYATSFPFETKRHRQAGWYFPMERAFDIAVAYQLEPRKEFLDAIVGNLNYDAGCNPVNICYLAGLGWIASASTCISTRGTTGACCRPVDSLWALCKVVLPFISPTVVNCANFVSRRTPRPRHLIRFTIGGQTALMSRPSLWSLIWHAAWPQPHF